MEKLLNTYRDLTSAVRKEPVDVVSIGTKNGTTVTVTEVREKPIEFQSRTYKAFIVEVDGVKFYADFEVVV